MVRIFMPVTVADQVTGKEKNIGTVETGYWQADRAKITDEQVGLLEPFVDQAAVAVYKAQLYEQARRRADVLQHLYDVGQAIQRAVGNLSLLMEEIGNAALQVLQADIVILYDYDQANRQISLLHVAGEVRGPGQLTLDLDRGNILDHIIATRKPFYTDDAQNCPELVGYGPPDGKRTGYHTFTQRQEVRAFAGIPLIVGERLTGIMCVNYRQPHQFFSEDKCTIGLFAQQAAVAMENARLKEMDRQHALQEDRDYLSRELHDASVQDLYGIDLKARTLLQQTGLDRSVTITLRQILELAEKAKRQIGFLVDELSSPLPGYQNFQETIRESVERIRQFYGLEVIYQENEIGQMKISQAANIALAHIAKESMTNAVRHAHAKHIWVSYWFQETDGTVCLQVRDDGSGFDPNRRRRNHHGLDNMREFASEAGGQIHIDSAAGQGTQVSVTVPVRQER